MADVWLSQASVSLGTGDADGAFHLAAMAVAHEEHRPSAWVAGRVARLDRRSGGAFADLTEQTARWRHSTA